MKRKKVLILGGGLQCLSTAYSLKKEGHFVSAFVCKGTEAAHSKNIDQKVYVSDSEFGSHYIQHLVDFLNKDQHDVIIPMSDKLAELLSKNKKQIESCTKAICAVPEYHTFEVANDKWKLIQLCQKHNFPHPKTAQITDSNIEQIAKYVGFPALIKPNHSVGARGIKRVNSYEELKATYQSILSQYGESTLQEYIETNGAPYYNIMLYRDKNGNIINHTIIEIIRYYPVKGGSSSLCKTIENDYLLKLCSEVLEALSWEGFADFDILKKSNNEYQIIEINPRVPASLRAAEISGINFPNIIVSNLLELPIKQYHYSTNKYLRFLGLDIMWFISSKDRFAAQPSWFKFFDKDTYYQEGGKADLTAMLFSLYSGVKKIFTPSFRKAKNGI
jgi:predicted ATP-grasp superfamily ATP-dependent carboligase